MMVICLPFIQKDPPKTTVFPAAAFETGQGKNLSSDSSRKRR